MVDSSEALESMFLTVAMAKASTTKRMVVIDPGEYEETKEKDKRLTLIVNVDGKKKKWRPNKDSVQNMQVLGIDTVGWVGHPLQLEVNIVNGRELVIVKPIGTRIMPATEQYMD